MFYLFHSKALGFAMHYILLQNVTQYEINGSTYDFLLYFLSNKTNWIYSLKANNLKMLKSRILVSPKNKIRFITVSLSANHLLNIIVLIIFVYFLSNASSTYSVKLNMGKQQNSPIRSPQHLKENRNLTENGKWLHHKHKKQEQ